jgi:hypothetical protein
MPCHPLEPLRCPSCGVSEGAEHLDACAVYRIPGVKRKIYFAPSSEVKAAIPYTPGERQAVAEIPRRIDLTPKPETPKDPLKDALDYLGQEFVKERVNHASPRRHDAILKAIDALQALRLLENSA